MVPYTQHLQKSHGPMGGENWSQQLSKRRYLSTDLSTRSIDHGRYRRSIKIHLLKNTVDIDGRCRFTYGELWSIVDGGLKIEIILWSISSTYFTLLGKFRGEANVEKHADPGKKNWNSRKLHENSRNLSEGFLRSRKEENLYGHCDMNNARRILSKGSTLLRGCWFWSTKLYFQKSFGRNFIAVKGVTHILFNRFLYLDWS